MSKREIIEMFGIALCAIVSFIGLLAMGIFIYCMRV